MGTRLGGTARFFARFFGIFMCSWVWGGFSGDVCVSVFPLFLCHVFRSLYVCDPYPSRGGTAVERIQHVGVVVRADKRKSRRHCEYTHVVELGEIDSTPGSPLWLVDSLFCRELPSRKESLIMCSDCLVALCCIYVRVFLEWAGGGVFGHSLRSA